ncbi:hypothetical protein DFH09DRAFT_1367402 [Mycena vulgaris]|nr:hypothetical protein DFH09DRAFT_1367402 [Mycena vulgaris]
MDDQALVSSGKLMQSNHKASPGMHRCWSVPEITRMITETIGGTTSDRVALSRLAVTCRLLLDPALDSLWRRQTSFLPLLDILIERKATESPYSFFLAAALNPDHWDRVMFYAPRIKEISVTPHDSGLSLEILELFSISWPGDFLLPNLQRFIWSPGEDSWVPYIRLFLSPKITKIDLTMTGGVSCIALLPCLPRKYPNLAHLTVDMPGSFAVDHPTSCAVSTMIQSLRKIQTLSLHSVHSRDFPHLASLPALRLLTILNMEHRPFPDRYPPHSHPTFPALKCLYLYEVFNLSAVTSFMNVLSDSRLDEFRMTSRRPADEASLSSLLSSINRRCSHRSLTRLDIRAGGTQVQAGGLNSEVHTFLSTTLRPLLAFVNLEDIRIEAPVGFSLDEDLMAAMARAWSRITSLFFCTGGVTVRPPGPTPIVTIRALQLFAFHCRHLCYLCIPFTGHFPPIQDRVPHHSRPLQTALKKLYVMHCPIDSPFPVAAFLTSMFPKLTDIYTGKISDGAGEDNPRVKWREVERLLPLVATVHADDETYWRAELGNPRS